MTVTTSGGRECFKRFIRGALKEVRGLKYGELQEHHRKFGEPQTELGGPQKEL